VLLCWRETTQTLELPLELGRGYRPDGTEVDHWGNAVNPPPSQPSRMDRIRDLLNQPLFPNIPPLSLSCFQLVFLFGSRVWYRS
jgi:hypothetical protein